MEEFKQRIKDELSELINKCDRLDKFMNSKAFYALDMSQQHLLRAQFGAMTSYRWILSERLRLIEKK